jgi:hypothetical protein
MRRAFAVTVVAALTITGAIGLAQCGTDYASDASDATEGGETGQGVGGEREPCYANGTCNAGLTCLSNVCVNAGDGGASGGDGGAGASGGDADAHDRDALDEDSGCFVGKGHAPCYDTQTITCIDNAGNATCTNTSNACTTISDNPFECYSAIDCDPGSRCCIVPKTAATFEGCSALVHTNTNGGAFCGGASCPSSGVTLCGNDAECADAGYTECARAAIVLNGGGANLTLGVCH